MAGPRSLFCAGVGPLPEIPVCIERMQYCSDPGLGPSAEDASRGGTSCIRLRFVPVCYEAGVIGA